MAAREPAISFPFPFSGSDWEEVRRAEIKSGNGGITHEFNLPLCRYEATRSAPTARM
jgi:hypothetical protein